MDWINMLHSPLYSDSFGVSELNWGLIEVDLHNKSVQIDINDINGKPFFKRSFNLDGGELTFNRSRLGHNNDWCVYVQRE